MSTATSLRANLLLLLAAAIWGLAFVAQRAGMEYIGPFMFNAARFLLGTLTLVPLLFVIKSQTTFRSVMRAGLPTGVVLFLGASLQQIAMQYTTAGKAGFITGLYVVLVPLFGIFLGRVISLKIWLGAALALVGLYLLSVTENLSVNKGDLLVLSSALFWATHVLLIDHFVKKVDPVPLSVVQFGTCTLLSLLAGGIWESIDLAAIQAAWVPIFYAGVMSVGIAYTLQVVAQREANPNHTAIILSLEGVFAVLGGWLMLQEALTLRMLIGCGFMFAAMVVTQWRSSRQSTLSS